MLLNRRQTKALIDVCDDGQRQALAAPWVAVIDGKVYLCATDSYIAVGLRLPDSFKEYEDRRVDIDELIKWYKLSGSKDIITETVIEGMLLDMDTMITPPRLEKAIMRERCSRQSITLEPKLLTILSTLAGGNMEFTCFSNQTIPPYNDYMLRADYQDNFYIIMPLRKGVNT